MTARDLPEGSPFKVKITVFMPDSLPTSIKLRRGERLFVLTDNGLDEAPHVGPQEVLTCTEYFGCWPVVAIQVTDQHADSWRAITSADCARMMKRIRSALAPKGTPND